MYVCYVYGDSALTSRCIQICSSSRLLVWLSPVLSAADAVPSPSPSPPSPAWSSTDQPGRETARFTSAGTPTLTWTIPTWTHPAPHLALSKTKPKLICQMLFAISTVKDGDVTWASYQPSLIFLDSASEPVAFLHAARAWAAYSFLSTAHTWDRKRALHQADKCLYTVKHQCNLNSAFYQSLCKSSLLFVLSCLAVHGAATKWWQTIKVWIGAIMPGGLQWCYSNVIHIIFQGFTWLHVDLSPVLGEVKELFQPSSADGCVQGSTLTHRAGETVPRRGNEWRLLPGGCKINSHNKT